MVTNHEQQGLQVVTVEGKGRGITTTIPFKKRDYVCSHSGDLLSRAEGIDREQQYSDDVGCYLFFFAHNGVIMWYIAQCTCKHVYSVPFAATVLMQQKTMAVLGD